MRISDTVRAATARGELTNALYKANEGGIMQVSKTVELVPPNTICYRAAGWIVD